MQVDSAEIPLSQDSTEEVRTPDSRTDLNLNDEKRPLAYYGSDVDEMFGNQKERGIKPTALISDFDKSFYIPLRIDLPFFPI